MPTRRKYKLWLLGAGLAVLVLAALVYRRRPADDDACAIGIVASLLLPPWTLDGYLLLLLPIFFSRPWTGPIRVVVVLLTVPWLVYSDAIPYLNDAALLILAAMYLRDLVPFGLIPWRRPAREAAW